MNKPRRKWGILKTLIKFAVCATALWYLSTKVTLSDYARLADEPHKKYLLTSRVGVDSPDQALRIRDLTTGRERTVSRSELAHQTQLAKDQRPIELGLKTILSQTDGSWVGWALLAMGPSVFIMGWRLRCLLKTQDIAISYRDSVLLTFAGNFFNFAMPGTTGGDLYKAYHIAKHTHKRTEGITVVVLDRVVGLISFLLIAAVTIFAARKTSIIGVYGRWVGYLMLVMIASGMLFFSKRIRSILRYDTWLGRLPFADKLRRIDETAFSFRYHRRQAVASLVVTLLNHFFIVTSIYFLARSLGIHPSLGRSAGELYLACVISAVVGYLFSAIPISVQGFGLMEAIFFKVMVEGQWCNASQMIALTLGARLVQIIWSLPGLLVPWLGLERPRQVASDENLGHLTAASD